MKDINELKEKLRLLPKGYISIKNISNNRYFYLKYYDDNGKQISKYIKANEIEIVKKQLEERKRIEKEIKEYENQSRNLSVLSNNIKNLTGNIMSGDVVVAKYNNGDLVYKNDKLCPLLINRTNSITAFFKGRAIDSNRTNSRLLKKVLNINTNRDEYVSLYAYGAVITDNYWFKPKGSKLKYKDICFNNDFYSDLALKGELEFYPKSPKHSPQITTIGSFEKCWKKIGDDWWLYKKGTKEQIFSEIFCSLLAKTMNIETAEYEYDDGFIRTKNFAKKYNFEPMYGLVGDDESYETIFNTLLNIDTNLADQYMMLSFFDCVVNNIDRHNENLGLLRNRKTGKIVSLAPNFDNNLALLGYDRKLKMKPSEDGLIKPFIKFLKNNKEAYKRFKTIKISKLNNKNIEKCIEQTRIDADGYDVINYVLDRYNYIKSI